MSVKISVFTLNSIREPKFGQLSEYAREIIYTSEDDSKLRDYILSMKGLVEVDDCFIIKEEDLRKIILDMPEYKSICETKIDFDRFWLAVSWY